MSSVFLEKPQVIYVDEDYDVKPPAYSKIDKLMESLQKNGPLVAEGKMGPNAYTQPPFKLKDRVNDKEIYGWRPQTSSEHTPSTNVILLGASQTESKSYIYYTLANDMTRDQSSLIRGYVPSSTDTKIYVMSYESFLNRALVNLHPICPQGQWLFSVSVNSILDGGETEKKCKQVGQEIFDHYKTAAKGDSEAGKNAVQRICEAARVLTNDGSTRKTHIERAWDGIGDASWRWQS